ncbi:MAG: hypothetical protein PQJ59_05370 [Spirochaetales bacterium]|nr:hypothetical protein [Spirochaetales bacterium]
MAENANYQLRSQPPMPDFFKFDQIQKEEYLSQLGNFNQEQRAIFHKLCEVWEPEIEYNRFIELGKNQFSFIQSHLSQLMQKLFNARCGLLKVSLSQGHIGNNQVILCERDSIRFFYYYIENEFTYSLHSEDKLFITPKLLERQDIILPGKYVEPLGMNDISETLYHSAQDQVRIFLVKAENYDSLYVTPASIPHLIRLSREKIKVVVKSPQLLTYLSKTMGMMESEITKSLKDRDHSFWNKLSRCLIENKDEVADKRRHIHPEYYPAVSLLYAYTRNGLDEAERIRQDRQSQKDELVSVCQAIEMRSEKFLTQQELNDYLENGIKKWPDFKNTFYEKCVKNKNKTSLPLIVNLGTGYMHRDHIYLTFRMSLQDAAIELKQYYLGIMDDILTSPRGGGVTVFATTDSFLLSIRERIKERYPLLDTLLDKPKILSEGILHWSKKRSSTPSADQVRKLLNKYYEEDSTLRFKRLDKLLELYLQSLFMQAYSKLPVIRKVFLRLFGRYDSYLESFSRLPDTPRASKARGSKAGASGDDSFAGKSLSPGLDPKERYHHREKTGRSSYSRKKRVQKEKERRYSHREQNNAWTEFQDALKKSKD